MTDEECKYEQTKAWLKGWCFGAFTVGMIVYYALT